MNALCVQTGSISSNLGIMDLTALCAKGVRARKKMRSKRSIVAYSPI